MIILLFAAVNKVCAANVTTNCVKFSAWGSFEQSVCF